MGVYIDSVLSDILTYQVVMVGLDSLSKFSLIVKQRIAVLILLAGNCLRN